MRLSLSFLPIMRNRLIVLVTVFFLGGATWGLWHWRGAGARSPRYRSEKVTRGRVAALINASGTVVPEEVVDVGAQVAGRIVEFGKDPDESHRTIDYRSRVEKGTVLARIDARMYEAEVGIAQADLAVAQAEVKRLAAELEASKARADQANRDLQRARRGGTGVSGLELDALAALYETARAGVPATAAALEKAKESVERARSMLAKAQTNLEYTVIVSPVKGVIIDRRVNIGQTVVSSLNAPSLFLIAKDLKRMQVWASVNEADIGRIHVGMPAHFKVDAYPDDVFTGVVTQIRLNASMTQNVVTYTVVVNTNNEHLELLPYLTANLQFRTAFRDDVLLASNAALRYRPAPDRILPEQQADYAETRQRKTTASEWKPGTTKNNPLGTVWVEEEGYLRAIVVRTGLSDGSVTEIIPVDEDELTEGDVLVTAEVQEQAATGSNPFAVQMWSGKKKE